MAIPTLKAIMAEKGCGIDLAKTYRAKFEVEADHMRWRQTGRHALTCTIHRDIPAPRKVAKCVRIGK